MSRRRFLQTSAAYAICLAAINRVMGRAVYAAECDPKLSSEFKEFPLDWPGAQMGNPAGEFVMDLQTHHVDSGGSWRASNPGMEAFFSIAWSQSRISGSSFPYPGGCGEPDPIECLGRFHYMKELFLDSSTNVCVLSAVPFREDGNPLPTSESGATCDLINGFAGIQQDGSGRRIVMHRFVMPNRGSLGNKTDAILGKSGVDPLFMKEEFDFMERDAALWGASQGDPRKFHLRAWKVYTPWGDVPNTSGWWLDDPVGVKFIYHALDLSRRYGVPRIICAHKGFALPTFDQEKAATRDVGVVARMFGTGSDAMNFLIYHSGYDGDGPSGSLGGPLNQGTSAGGPYPLDVAPDGTPQRGAGSEDTVRSIDRGVDNLIKALRENGWSARHFAPGGSPGTALQAGDGDPLEHANVPNVYAELGSVWGSV
ncbi:MAG: hypothetical protein ACREQ9_26535, partial [Candidatus Binatia bacterium]